MSLYVDTSVWVSVLVPERESERSTAWLERNLGQDIRISHRVRAEFSSALSLKVRTRQIDVAAQSRSLTGFERMGVDTSLDLAIISEDFLTAARWCDDHRTGLRAGDALHMAVSHRNGATLCTLDRRLHEAAEMLGIRAERI